MGNNVGDIIKIDYMEGEPQYWGKTGEITHIDDAGQLHGTWGGCALCAEYGDRWITLTRVEDR